LDKNNREKKERENKNITSKREKVVKNSSCLNNIYLKRYTLFCKKIKDMRHNVN
jgi:hypothetical protein